MAARPFWLDPAYLRARGGETVPVPEPLATRLWRGWERGYWRAEVARVGDAQAQLLRERFEGAGWPID